MIEDHHRSCTSKIHVQKKQQRKRGRRFLSGYAAANIWVFPKIGVSHKGWFIMENHIEIYR